MRTINRLCGGALTLARVISQKILVAALLSLFISRSTFALPLYTAIDLGTLGGTTSIAYGVNNIGQVVGQADTLGNATSNAFIYSNDAGMKDLGTFGGTSSYANDINDSGTVVGAAFIPGNAVPHAFLYTQADGIKDLFASFGGGFSAISIAYGINNSGQIVGSSGNAFVYTPPTSVQTLPASKAFDVNITGQVVGFDGRHAFLYSPNSSLHDLGTFGGTNSFANAINDSGVVVGWAELAGNSATEAFVYIGTGAIQSIGVLGNTGSSAAIDINSKGEVVGTSNNRAFLYTHDSGMVDLNSLLSDNSGLVLASAYGINDKGQIVGRSDSGHAFLATPVPLPAAVWLLGSALGGLGLARSRLAERRRC